MREGHGGNGPDRRKGSEEDDCRLWIDVYMADEWQLWAADRLTDGAGVGSSQPCVIIVGDKETSGCGVD